MITNWLTSTKFPFYLELGWLLLTFLLWSILCVKYYKTYPLLIIWWNHFHVLDCPYTLTVSYKLARTSGYLHLPGFYPHILPPSVSHSLCFTYTLITSSQDTIGIWILIKAFCKCFMILQCRNLKGIIWAMAKYHQLPNVHGLWQKLWCRKVEITTLQVLWNTWT